mgnify:FL=1|jgi:hypothetical protein|tara:strand:- start:25 stop:528 length:504 start_codon:yes stop_codon:yes gene_type:complete
MIEVFDNILSERKSRYIHNCVSILSWTFEYQPVTPPLVNKHWYSDGKSFIDDIFKDLLDATELKGLDSLKKCYLLGHTHGLEQQSHYDASDFTMIYYPKLDWKPEWGGGTLVGDTLVKYKPNRLVMFSCDQIHQGQPISKQCFELRPIIVFQCYAESAMVERLSWQK